MTRVENGSWNPGVVRWRGLDTPSVPYHWPLQAASRNAWPSAQRNSVRPQTGLSITLRRALGLPLRRTLEILVRDGCERSIRIPQQTPHPPHGLPRDRVIDMRIATLVVLVDHLGTHPRQIDVEQ
jgi:hypothetical protein